MATVNELKFTRRVAWTLRKDLGMTYKQIGAYVGLHTTSVYNLIKHGHTTSASRKAIDAAKKKAA